MEDISVVDAVMNNISFYTLWDKVYCRYLFDSLIGEVVTNLYDPEKRYRM